MKRLSAVAFAITLAIQAGSFAQDEPSSPAQRIKLITAAHQEKMVEFSDKLKSLSREEQREYYQNNYPSTEGAVAEITGLVKANPQDEASVEAINWALRNSRSAKIPTEFYTALEEHHLNNDSMIEILIILMRHGSNEAQNFLEIVRQKSEHKDVRGVALYAKAITLEGHESKVDELTALVALMKKEHPELEMRGRNLVKSLEGKLFATTNLAIGKEAPEVVGKDVDGNEMKLSDYRGKVVVIDFWGDW